MMYALLREMDSNMGKLLQMSRLLSLAVFVMVFSSLEIVVSAQNGCPCDALGTANFTSFCDSTTSKCHCKAGFSGPFCTDCSAGFYRYSANSECLPCHCNEFGSLGMECTNSTGQCSCIPGVGGATCESCLDESQWWDGKKCRTCDCYQYSDECSSTNGHRNDMCKKCSRSPNFTTTCDSLCPQGFYKDTNGTCMECPFCQVASSNTTSTTTTTTTAPTTTTPLLKECHRFSERCLRKCSHSGASHSQSCRTCHKYSSVWNCTKIETPGEQPTKKGSGSKPFKNYYVYVAAGGGALLCTALISTIIFVKRKRAHQKPMMPLWTIELKQDDQVSFTDYNDVDVMYLDDSYLMEPSEVFTTSTDSMDERIGYKTLS